MRLDLADVFNPQQKINFPVAFSFILLLGSLVAWYSLTKAEEVARIAAQSSPAFNINVRINNNGLNNKTNVHPR